MSETLRHGLPLLSAGQAQKEVTHNEALLVLDRLLHPVVLSRSVSVPPLAPAQGDAYVIGVDGSGAWAGRSGDLASHDGFGWVVTTPVRGCLVFIADENCFSVFNNGWSINGWPSDGLRISGRRVLGATPISVSGPEGGGVVDNQSRIAINQLIDVLRDQGIVI